MGGGGGFADVSELRTWDGIKVSMAANDCVLVFIAAVLWCFLGRWCRRPGGSWEEPRAGTRLVCSIVLPSGDSSQEEDFYNV
jgi:hypothetical protein